MIEVGCYVTIGKGSLTWEVLTIQGWAGGTRRAAELRSGQSGRYRCEWLDHLVYHSAPTPE